MKAPALTKIETLAGGYTAICRTDGALLPEAATHLRQAADRQRAELFYADEFVPAKKGAVLVQKVGFAPDTMLSYDCMGSPLFVRDTLRRRIGLPESYDAKGVYAYALRAAAAADGVCRIPKPLFRGGRIEDFDGVKAVQAVLPLLGRNGVAAQGAFQGSTMVRYGLRKPAPLSVVVTAPGAGAGQAVRATLETVEQRTGSVQTELIVAVGGLPDCREAAYYDALESAGGAKIVCAPGEENDARLKNLGAAAANGAYLLFLEAGVCPAAADALPTLLAQAQQPYAGAVGGKVLDAAGRILHAGLICGEEDVPVCPCHGMQDVACGQRWETVIHCMRNVSLLGAGAFLLSTELFYATGGFDETFDTCFCEAALCMRLTEKRRWNVYTPYASFCAPSGSSLPRRKPLSKRNAERCTDLFRALRVHGDPHWPWTAQ